MNRLLILNFICLLLAGSANAQQTVKKYICDFDKQISGEFNLNNTLKDIEFPHSGKAAAELTPENIYGPALEVNIPNDLKNRNFELVYLCYLRLANKNDNAVLVTSVQKGDSTIYWNSRDIKPFIKTNEWNLFTDTLLLPADIDTDATVKMFIWNNNAAQKIWVDDIRVSFINHKHTTYLPLWEDISNDTKNAKEIANTGFCKFLYLKQNGQLVIANLKGDPLIKQVVVCLDKGPKEKPDYKLWSVLKQTGVSRTNGKLTLDFFAGHPWADITIQFVCDSTMNSIKVKTTTTYKINAKVYRTAVGLISSVANTKLITSAGDLITQTKEDEFWINTNGGALYGETGNTWSVLKPANLSSIQVNKNSNSLWLNADYYLDHPHLYMPLKDSARNIMEDYSAMLVKSGQRLSSEFEIRINSDFNFPRIFPHQSGNLSTLLFTEHADWSTLQSHRAVYFGNEEITDITNAMGGFSFYKIPVTKSVFYNNINKSKFTKDNNSLGLTSELVSIKGNKQFEEFLIQLKNNGNEICLHTPEDKTTTKANVNEALKYMSKNFNSKTWIDHGYDNSPSDNREDISCDGLNPASVNFIGDALKKNNVHYLWQPYYEDIAPFKKYTFNANLTVPYKGFGNFIPSPDCWMHPNYDSSFTFWPTSFVMEAADPNLWDYVLSNQRIAAAIQQHAPIFLHVYPPALHNNYGFIKQNENGKLITEPKFNEALSRIAAFREKGFLNTSTITEYLGYLKQLDNIEYIIKPNENIHLKNKSDKTIKGFTLVGQEPFKISNKAINQKIYKNNYYVWFDLQPLEEVEIIILR